MCALSAAGISDTSMLGTLAVIVHSKQLAGNTVGNGICSNSLSDLGHPTCYIHNESSYGAVFIALVLACIADIAIKEGQSLGQLNFVFYHLVN